MLDETRRHFNTRFMPALRKFFSALLCLTIAQLAAGADLNVPENILFESGVEYANPDNQHLQLNIARPKKGDGPFPAVLCIHGGGFRAGKRDGYDGLCVRLAQQGYVAATASYR